MRRFFLLFSIFVLSCSLAFAHPGDTDANGGHYDRSTGEYHYHHGYSAHQHTNGVCPYDFDDKTGQNSGTPSTKKHTTAPRVTSTPRPSSTKSKSSFIKNLFSNPFTYIIGGIIISFCVISITASMEKKERERKEELARIAFEKEKQELRVFYSSHTLREVCSIPDNIVIRKELYYRHETFVPYERDIPDGCTYGASIDVYLSTNCYHKKTCYHVRHRHAENAYIIPRNYFSACGLCKPPPLPSMTWYKSLHQHVSKCEKYGITPRIDD